MKDEVTFLQINPGLPLVTTLLLLHHLCHGILPKYYTQTFNVLRFEELFALAHARCYSLNY